ncbi:MAG TPA: aminotransferase class III-fold pyridoxal phosphate-dependent enzyme [Pirellulales bacterium]|jgi:4-aminobutyrate aminotransferase-like enzyme|nr:aminotransferase class III-fold pyridoxal phosphate-dependent enzyme [Pirellulales bacterium]
MTNPQSAIRNPKSIPQFPKEGLSNDIRRRIAAVEPHCLRTFTPSLAVLAKSAGCYHWTPEGRKLVDFTSGVLVMNLGHNPIRWWNRVLGYLGLTELATAGDFCQAVTLNAYNSVTEIETIAAERLVGLMRAQPGGTRCEQVLWAASGSEAIQKAVWAALDRRPGEDIILSTRHGFHGKKGLAGAVTGSEQDPERDPRVKFLSFPREECVNVARRREPLDLAVYQAQLASLWKEYGRRIACLITEPYLGGGGSYHPQKEYIQLLARFCHEHDVVFIFDEVQANFGRTGSLFAYTEYGVEPDIVVVGKALGNGVPVSAAMGRADLFANMHYGEGSDTWSANPLASAAVLATLDEYETTEVIEHSRKLSQVIEAGLLRLTELDTVAHVRGEGVVWGVECAEVGGRSAADVANACVEACYLGDASGRAIHLLGPLAQKVIRVAPPLVLPLDEARQYLDAMYGIFAEVGRRFR